MPARAVQIALLQLTAIAACDAETLPQAVQQRSGSTAPAALVAEELSEAERNTAGLLVRGLNLLQEAPAELISEYHRRVPLRGPAPGFRVSLGAVADAARKALESASRDFARAREIAPVELGGLPQAAIECAELLQLLITAFSDVERHFGSRGLEPDAYQVGRSLHERFLNRESAYTKCLSRLGRELDKLERRQVVFELSKFADQDSAGHLFRRVQLDAKHVLAAVSWAEYDSSLQQLQRTLGRMRQLPGTDGEPLLDAFSKQAQSFVKAAEQMDRGRVTALPEVHPLRRPLVLAYNDLTSAANALRARGK